MSSKEVEVSPETVTITLTPDEAEIMKALTGNVIGSGPIRVLVDQLYHLLGDGTGLYGMSKYSKYIIHSMEVSPTSR